MDEVDERNKLNGIEIDRMKRTLVRWEYIGGWQTKPLGDLHYISDVAVLQYKPFYNIDPIKRPVFR